MKHIYLCLLVLLLLTACAPQEYEGYTFGFVFPLSGSNSFYGEYSAAGAELAIEDINAAGGVNGKPVRAIYEDTAGDKRQATVAAQKLITINDAAALFTVTTPMGGAIAPIGEDYKIPTVYQSSTNSFTDNKTYVFKDFPSAEQTCVMLTEKALADGHEKVALFGTDAEFTYICRDGINVFDGALDAFETYTFGDGDFRTQFTKIQNSDSTAIILLAFSNDCISAYRQIQELGMEHQLYLPFNSFGCGSVENTEAGAPVLGDAFASDIAIDTKSEAFKVFKARLEERGTDLQVIGSAMTYDSILLVAKAYEGCETTECVAANMHILEQNGPSGTFRFGDSQIADRVLTLLAFSEGEWVPIE